jgi:oligosaccharide repeat unit polymerase
MIRGKFSSGSSLNLPFYVNSIIICSMAFGYTYCTILAKNIVYKRKGYNKLLAINVIIPIFITILSGSRGSSLEVIVVFAVSILFYYYKKYNWKKTLDFKYFILCVLLLLLIMYAFFAIKGVMGRGAFDPSKYYDEFCIYLGSQVKNLDIYLNKDMYHTNVFAYSTLRDFYNIFNSYLGFNIKDSVKLLPFQIINGKELGNVYTCFYNYFMDFGYLGVVFFSSISGCVSEYVYKKAKISSNKSIDIWLIIYAYIAASLVFCFFGSRFYSNLMSAGFIRLLIWSFLIKIYLTRVKIFQNKKKVGK